MLTQESSAQISHGEKASFDPVGTAKIIAEKMFWQGSVIAGEDLVDLAPMISHSGWWVISSQTCNLYSASFDKIPKVELVAAREIPSGKLDSISAKGKNPRVLHTVAESEDGSTKLHLELDISDRVWIDRALLANLIACKTMIRNQRRDVGSSSEPVAWNDRFVGWMGRSYTRATLPDPFNEALAKSKLEKIFKDRLDAEGDDIYGIYMSIHHHSDKEWEGLLGLMPSPYNLEILVALEEHADAIKIKKSWEEALLRDVENPDPNNKNQKIPRIRTFEYYGIHLLPAAVTFRNIAEITVSEVKGLVRYSMYDFLSNAEMAAPDPEAG